MSAYRFESLWETRADLQYSMCSSGSVLSLFTLASQHSALTPQCHTVSQEREEGKKNSSKQKNQPLPGRLPHPTNTPATRFCSGMRFIN